MDSEHSGDYLRTGEVARRLGVSTLTVREMIEDGSIEGAIRPRRGGHYRIPAEAVRRALEAAKRRVTG